MRGGSILADGMMLMTDGNTKLYLIEPSPAGFKPLASAVILEPGDNWAPLAIADGTLVDGGQRPHLQAWRSRAACACDAAQSTGRHMIALDGAAVERHRRRGQ